MDFLLSKETKSKEEKKKRGTTTKRTSKVIVKSPTIDDVTEKIDKIAIDKDAHDIPENISTIYSKSGKHMFQYSNKKTPYENACPWLL